MQYYGMMRVAELTALQFSDIDLAQDVMEVRVRRSKTDQTGKGHTIYIEKTTRVYDAFTHLVKYIELLPPQLKKGDLFRRLDRFGHQFLGGEGIGPTGYNLRIKQWCGLAGLNSRNYSSHSLRKGGATTAALNGAPIPAI